MTATATEVTTTATVYTSFELAAKLKVSEPTIRRLARNRLIPGAVQLGNRWRFNRNAADRWMAGGGLVDATQARG